MIVGTHLTRRRVLAGASALSAAAIARPARAAVTLQFWDMIWGPQDYIDGASFLVERFNRENPAIAVQYRSVPWANWYQTFVTAVGSGTAPDISTGAGYQAVQLYDMGAILPIDDVIEELRKSGELADFTPGTVETLRYDGHTVSLPWGIDIRVWYHRRDHFADAKLEAPKDWAGLRAAAKALTRGDRYGMVGSGDTGGSHYLYSLMLNNGGGLFSPKRELAFRDPRNLEALDFLAGVVKDGAMHPASAGYASLDRRRAFIQGQASLILDTPGLVDQAGPEQAGNIALLPPPTAPHGDRGTVFWVNNIMLYQQTKHPDEVKTFLKWWSKNALALWTKGRCNQLPARASIAGDPYFQNDTTRKTILETYVPLGRTTATHASGIFPKLNSVEGEGMMQTLAQELLQGKEVAAAATKAEARLQDMMRA
jgi:multiple sugar transport system substrate-binding protein